MPSLPFVDYTPFHSLDDLERHAWAANDRATLRVIELAEDAADIAGDVHRDHRAELLCDARGVTAMRAELAEAKAEAIELRRELSRLRDLSSWVEFVIEPYTGVRYGRPTGNATKPAPKWADHLIRALDRAERGTL